MVENLRVIIIGMSHQIPLSITSCQNYLKRNDPKTFFLPPWPPKPDFNPNPTLYKNSSLKFLSIQLEGWFGFLRFDPQTQTRLDSKLQRTQTGNCTLSLVLKSNASQNDVKMPVSPIRSEFIFSGNFIYFWDAWLYLITLTRFVVPKSYTFFLYKLSKTLSFLRKNSFLFS